MLSINKNKRGSGIIIDPISESYGHDGLELVAGIDAGSTQTRVALADHRDAAQLMQGLPTLEAYARLRDQVYVIPSTYAVVYDEREIRPNSDNLEDNFDSRIIRIRSAATKPLVGSERIVRGRKITDSSGLVARYLDSSSNKMDNPIFYLNVLDGLGYAIMQKYNGAIPEKVRVHLVLSVRPKELNAHCQERMNTNLVGEFVFRWQNLTINIEIVDATYTTEPEAQITGTSAIMDLAAELNGDDRSMELSKKFAESDSYIHIEGGGSSIGVEVIKNGNIVSACSSTFQLGGNYLIKILTDRLRESKGRIVSEESVKAAIASCLLKNGREREDISEVVASCKNQVGLDIVERVRHDVIDRDHDLAMTDMDFITLGGRLFRTDMAGTSVGHYIAEYISQMSPNTEVIILEDNYIPQGNLVLGLNEHELDAPSYAHVTTNNTAVLNASIYEEEQEE